MKELSEVTQKLDKKIDKAIVELKLEGIANVIHDFNAQYAGNASDFNLEIYTHEKRMRRDCFYDPQETFDSAFNAEIVAGSQRMNLKEYFKDLVLFAMKYRATKFYIEFSIQESNYNTNDILNQFINRGFINENTKYTKAELFDTVVNKLADKGANVAQYLYQEPAPQSQWHTEDESRRLQQQLLATLGQESTPRNESIPRYKI